MIAQVEMSVTGWIFCVVGVGGLVLVNSLLVACETGFIQLRYRSVEKDENEESFVPFSFIQKLSNITFVTRFSGVLAAYILGVLVSSEMVLRDSILLHCAVLLLALCVWYTIAEWIPRSWALTRPEKAVRVGAPVARSMEVLLKPLFFVIRRSARFAARLAHMDYAEEFDISETEVKLQAITFEEPATSSLAKKVVMNGLRLSELVVSDVMLPRNQVQIFDLTLPLQDNIRMAKAFGHTRYPLCREDLDKCIGVIHIKDIFRFKGSLENLDVHLIKREITSVGSEQTLEDALKLLLHKKAHMALVLDEFDGVIGVITLENIFEQLVGAIDDEFDTAEEDKVSAISLVDYKVDGLTPLHDLEQKLHIQIDSPDASTFGGLIVSELGRLPEVGEKVVLSAYGLSLTVDEADNKRILSATVRKC